MTVQTCAVAVKKLPERLMGRQGRIFLNELIRSVNTDGASIVLDCSSLRQIDRAAIYLLLCCLEEAMKHDGDVKLAAIPSEARAILKLTGIDGLFESFDTNAEAIISFSRFPVDLISKAHVPFGSHRAPENAA
jgi:anti-anti-sigma regulatory factor